MAKVELGELNGKLGDPNPKPPVVVEAAVVDELVAEAVVEVEDPAPVGNPPNWP